MPEEQGAQSVRMQYTEQDSRQKAAAFTERFGENATEFLRRTTGEAQERRVHDLKPVAQLSNREIVSEARELHSHFRQLSEQYNQAPAGQRAHLRGEMEPLVNRERELRQEYTARASQELGLERVPEQQISYRR